MQIILKQIYFIHSQKDIYKKIFSLSITLLTLSLSAATPDNNIEKFIADKADEAVAVFWCKYCNVNKSKNAEIDLKEHLASAHKRCGTCEKEFPSKGAVRFHEAEHFSSADLKLQLK